MDIGKYLEIDELKGRFFILDLPREFQEKIKNVVLDFRCYNFIEIYTDEWIGCRTKYIKSDYISQIHLYDDKEKIIEEYELDKVECNISNYGVNHKWEFKYTFKGNIIYKQIRETVEPMFNSGLFDGNDNINYDKKQIKELLKNYIGEY